VRSRPGSIYFNLLTNTTNYSGNVTGPNDIIAAPRLSDEVHLARGSPAIDAGEMTSCVPPTDLNGIPRPRDGNCDGSAVVDIGAAEYYGCAYLPTVLRDYRQVGLSSTAGQTMPSP
jgi:hypothetical protein